MFPKDQGHDFHIAPKKKLTAQWETDCLGFYVSEPGTRNKRNPIFQPGHDLSRSPRSETVRSANQPRSEWTRSSTSSRIRWPWVGSYCVHVDFSSGEVGAWGSCPVLHVSCVQAVRVQVGLHSNSQALCAEMQNHISESSWLRAHPRNKDLRPLGSVNSPLLGNISGFEKDKILDFYARP